MTHDPAMDLTATSFFIARHEEHFRTSYQSFAVKQLIFPTSSQFLMVPSAQYHCQKVWSKSLSTASQTGGCLSSNYEFFCTLSYMVPSE